MEKEEQIIKELHPDIVVGEDDNFVLRVFFFPREKLLEMDDGAMVSSCWSSPSLDKLPITKEEREGVRKIKETRPRYATCETRGYDIISVIRFSCGSFDVQPVNW